MQWQPPSCRMPLEILRLLNFKCLLPFLLLGNSSLSGRLHRENINVLNPVFWFSSVNCKATEEMEKQFAIIKSAENEADFNNALEYVQKCLQLHA